VSIKSILPQSLINLVVTATVVFVTFTGLCYQELYVSIKKNSHNSKFDLILSQINPDKSNNETLKKEIVYNEFGDIVEKRDYRKGYAYLFKDDLGLISITKYSYVR